MKLAIIFNGQGAHYEGMGLDFQTEYATAKEEFELAEAATEGMPIREWIESDLDQFKETRNAQVAITATSLAIFNSIAPNLPAITFMAGLSLGEYTALMASGMLPKEAGYQLLKARGEIMSRHCEILAKATPVQMLAVMQMPFEEIELIVNEIKESHEELYIANINSSQQVILAGTEITTTLFKKRAKELGYKKTMPLKVEGPFHSPLMSATAEPFAEVLSGVEFSQTETLVISNTTVEAHDVSNVKNLLVRHLTEPVKWRQTIDFFSKQGVTHIIQIGPGKTLAQMLKREKDTPACLVIDKLEDVAEIQPFLNGGENE
ncbi:ACP S-malonyltransferase [Fundicoccus sp. Sow4_D5]|uniref:ACP S-malonyltransferase n=1 Tax=unclassified Fundicoccus TaxID=2761543 RepID=UPI003F93CC24